jgi:methionyl-tRNA formyltransferase
MKKHGVPATVLRSIESVVYRIVEGLRGDRLEHIEQAIADADVPVVHVENFNSPEAHAVIAGYQAILAISGGTRILSAETLRLFPMGILNAHQGLLPQYRGNYCNRWALLNGDQTGITVYRMAPDLDTGPILVKKAIDRERYEHFLDMENRFTAIGAELLVSTAQSYLAGEIEPILQNPLEGTKYGLLSVGASIRLYLHLWKMDALPRQF